MAATLTKHTRPYFVLLITDGNHVRTVAHVALAPSDGPEFADEHEGWMESAMGYGRDVVTVYATDYDTAREIALDDTRRSTITNHRAYGLQGMPRSAGRYTCLRKADGEPDVSRCETDAVIVGRLIAGILSMRNSRAWADGRTIHAESPCQKGTAHWEFQPID